MCGDFRVRQGSSGRWYHQKVTFDGTPERREEISQLRVHLGKKNSPQREQQVPRPWGEGPGTGGASRKLGWLE